MRQFIPLVVSGSSVIGKTAFSCRLASEYPNIFKLPSPIPKEDFSIAEAIQSASKENKIPIFETSDIKYVEGMKKIAGSAHSVFIMPPNIQVFREKLEKSQEKSQACIDNTIQNVEEQVTNAYESEIFKNEDFIIHNQDFEEAYKQFKDRVLVFYGLNENIQQMN